MYVTMHRPHYSQSYINILLQSSVFDLKCFVCIENFLYLSVKIPKLHHRLETETIVGSV